MGLCVVLFTGAGGWWLVAGGWVISPSTDHRSWLMAVSWVSRLTSHVSRLTESERNAESLAFGAWR
jgi:hypothetical protein